MDKCTDPVGGFRHVCPVCNKEFYAGAEWVYRKTIRTKKSYANLYLCSWTCFRKIERGEWNGL